jgi:hypothetical protein
MPSTVPLMIVCRKLNTTDALLPQKICIKASYFTMYKSVLKLSLSRIWRTTVTGHGLWRDLLIAQLGVRAGVVGRWDIEYNPRGLWDEHLSEGRSSTSTMAA